MCHFKKSLLLCCYVTQWNSLLIKKGKDNVSRCMILVSSTCYCIFSTFSETVFRLGVFYLLRLGEKVETAHSQYLQIYSTYGNEIITGKCYGTSDYKLPYLLRKYTFWRHSDVISCKNVGF